MCGIAGKVSERPFPLGTVLAMGEAISHRGPDDQGFVASGKDRLVSSRGPHDKGPYRRLHVFMAMAHRRLAIVDLSPRGCQPIPNEDASIWLACNGEIYNAPELRERLRGNGHVFLSGSDSEVVLHGYEEWGVEVVSRLRGMFAFALWDGHRQTLFCARDPMGIKPLYYRLTGDGLSFASEIKAFLAEPGFLVQPEYKAISQYLQYTFPVDDLTWFKGVRRLLPGHILIFDRDGIRLKRYHEFPVHEGSPGIRGTPESVLAALENAIESHLVADVAIGFHLSGGLDSSSLVALAASRMPPPSLHTFSGRFLEGREFDEKRYLDQVRRRFATTHHEVFPTARDLKASLPSIIWHLDEPVAGPGSLPQYFVSRLVREKGIKVVCCGQGADELFGGYPWYLPDQWTACEAKRRERLSVLQAMFPDLEIDDTKETFLARAPSRQEALMSWDVRYYLPALLHVEDRTSMAHSVESRVPFLDTAVVEIASGIPSREKVRDGVLKRVLRQAMAGRLPEAIIQRRDKMGFPTPIGPWFKGPANEWIRKVLCSGQAAKRGIMNTCKAAGILEEHACDLDRSLPLWQALNVELWFRIFVDGEQPEKGPYHY